METGYPKRTVVIIVNNDIVAGALKRVVESLGFEVCQDIESCREADFAFVGIYFAFLGIIRQLRAINPALPLVVIAGAEHEEGNREAFDEIYDVVTLDRCSETDVRHKIGRWFSEGHGKFLLERGSPEPAKRADQKRRNLK